MTRALARNLAPSDLSSRRNLFETLRIEHGPHGLIGRFFPAAENILDQLGLRLVTSSLAELVELQTSNIVSWPLFAPMLDPRLGSVTAEMSYGFVGLDREGRVACAQGGRIYDSGNRSVREMMDDHSFFYGPGRSPPPGQPICMTDAPVAAEVKGVFAYSGALWVHPAHRGHRLAALLPRISRTYALTHWNAAFTIAVVSNQIAASPLMSMYAYETVQPGFRMTNIGPNDYNGVFMAMTQQFLLDDLSNFLAGQLAEIDAAVGNGRAENQTPAASKRKR
jgi:hypothetical protein